MVNSAVILQVNSYYTIITDNNSSGDGDGDATETEDTEVAEVTVDTEDSADTAAATAVDCSLQSAQVHQHCVQRDQEPR